MWRSLTEAAHCQPRKLTSLVFYALSCFVFFRHECLVSTSVCLVVSHYQQAICNDLHVCEEFLSWLFLLKFSAIYKTTCEQSLTQGCDICAIIVSTIQLKNYFIEMWRLSLRNVCQLLWNGFGVQHSPRKFLTKANQHACKLQKKI